MKLYTIELSVYIIHESFQSKKENGVEEMLFFSFLEFYISKLRFSFF